MEKNRGVKILAISALVVAVIGLTVAFASMSQTLTIGGTATMDTESWDIHFANLAPTTVGAAAHEHASVTTEPTLASTSISGLEAVVTRPGDYVEYTFDVVNNGTINATLETLTKNTTPTCESPTHVTADETLVCGNLTYTLKYGSGNTGHTAGTAVAEDDTLNAGETVHLVLHLEYNSSATTLPTADVNISGLGISLFYEQA